MKVNFNSAFKNAFGEEIKENGKAVYMRDQLASILFSGTQLEKSGNTQTDNANKMDSYRLSLKIAAASGEFDITSEEAVMIKQAASLLTAGAYGQICDLIESNQK